ncbi:MAG TPA: hypothetical protein VKF62_05900, partial [Planctomycetota bacterium]|nr:hypothetical protein [Planctomycetota bacterium]
GLGGAAIETAGSAEVQVHGVPLVGGTNCTGQVAPAVSGPGVVLAQPPLPVLSLAGEPALATGTLTLSLSGGPADAVFGVLLDDSPAFFGIPGPFLGEFLLAPPSVLFVLGTLSSTGGFGMTIPLSGLPPSLAYTSFHLQGAALDGGGTWRLTNSVAGILRP